MSQNYHNDINVITQIDWIKHPGMWITCLIPMHSFSITWERSASSIDISLIPTVQHLTHQMRNSLIHAPINVISSGVINHSTPILWHLLIDLDRRQWSTSQLRNIIVWLQEKSRTPRWDDSLAVLNSDSTPMHQLPWYSFSYLRTKSEKLTSSLFSSGQCASSISAQ